MHARSLAPGGPRQMTLTFFFSDIEDSSGLAARLGEAYAPVLDERPRAAARCGRPGGRTRGRLPRRRALLRLRASRAGRRRGARDPAGIRGAEWPGRARARADRPALRRGGGRPAAATSASRFIAPRASARPDTEARCSSREAAARGLGVPRRSSSAIYEFRGLAEPERIFQLCADGLADEFPPLRGVRRHASTTRAVIADDSALLREGLARLLGEAEIDVVGQARNADELLLKVRSYHPDVAIVDIRMPPTQTDEGIRAAKEIRAKHPGTGVLVLSQHVAHTYAVELLARERRGARLPAQGPRGRRRGVHRRRPPRRRGRLRARPARRRRARRAQPRRRPRRAAVAARARGARADGRGTVEPRDRRAPLHLAARGREARDEHLHEAPAFPPRPRITGACSRCCASSTRNEFG